MNEAQAINLLLTNEDYSEYKEVGNLRDYFLYVLSHDCTLEEYEEAERLDWKEIEKRVLTCTVIQISYEDGRTEEFAYLPDYGSPSNHALAIMEGLFEEHAEEEEIISDGDRWYIEGVAEARWFNP